MYKQTNYQDFKEAYHNGTYKEDDSPEIHEGEMTHEPGNQSGDQEPEQKNTKTNEQAVDVGHAAESRVMC